MVTVERPATPALPRLGQSSADIAQQVSPPLWVLTTLHGALRHYIVGKHDLTVFFERDMAVAIHVAYPLAEGGERRSALQPEDLLPAGGNSPRVLIADTGWIVATNTCPLEYAKAAATLR